MTRAGIAVVLAVAAGCTPTRFHVAPYDRDAARADALAEHAAAQCRERRGEAEQPDVAFTSDGCSMWPDGGWAQCCIEHDVEYWCGGSAAERRRADDALAACVAARESETLGSVMRVGVIAGGIPWQPMPWRWGYGSRGIAGYED